MINKIILVLMIMGICLIGTDAFAMIGIDDYTVLMLHCDGTDGSTNFVDDSFSGHTVTACDHAQIDTAEKMFGTGSGKFDGLGDNLFIADHPDWNFGSGDFTIDFWIKHDVIASTYYSGQYATPGQIGWIFSYDYIHGLVLFYTEDGYKGLSTGPILFPWTPSAGTWYHVALVRNGNNLNAYINGSQIGLTNDCSGRTIFDSNAKLEISSVVGGGFIDGYLDEFRISRTARWTSDFSPPTEEYSIYTEPEPEPYVIPEPSSLLLLGFGLSGALFKRKVRSQSYQFNLAKITPEW